MTDPAGGAGLPEQHGDGHSWHLRQVADDERVEASMKGLLRASADIHDMLRAELEAERAAKEAAEEDTLKALRLLSEAYQALREMTAKRNALQAKLDAVLPAVETHSYSFHTYLGSPCTTCGLEPHHHSHRGKQWVKVGEPTQPAVDPPMEKPNVAEMRPVSSSDGDDSGGASSLWSPPCVACGAKTFSDGRHQRDNSPPPYCALCGSGKANPPVDRQGRDE